MVRDHPAVSRIGEGDAIEGVSLRQWVLADPAAVAGGEKRTRTRWQEKDRGGSEQHSEKAGERQLARTAAKTMAKR